MVKQYSFARVCTLNTSTSIWKWFFKWPSRLSKCKSVIKSGLRPIETPVVNRNDVYRGVRSKLELYKYTRNTKRKSHYVTVTNVIKRNAFARAYRLNTKANIWKLFFRCCLYRLSFATRSSLNVWSSQFSSRIDPLKPCVHMCTFLKLALRCNVILHVLTPGGFNSAWTRH